MSTHTTERERQKEELRRHMVSSEDINRNSELQIAKRRMIKRKRFRIIILVVLVFVLLSTVGIVLYQRFFTYSGYEVRFTQQLQEGSLVGYEYFNSYFLKYSRDGVSLLDTDGSEIWIESYEMKDPKVYVNNTYAIIADVTGNTVEIFGLKGRVGTATTQLPITKAVVSDTGIIAVLVEDTQSSYITFYNYDGESIDVTVKTRLAGDGYPTDISISPDGTALMVAYQFIETGLLRGRVVFYDFSEIGQNVPNRLVGGFDEEFSSSLIARVKYMDKTYSFAVATSGIYFFSSRNIASPSLIKSVVLESDIQAIAYSDAYVGLITLNTSSEEKYTLYVFDSTGSQIFGKDFSYEFKYFDIDGEYIYLYNDASVEIYNMAGTRKLYTETDFAIRKIKKVGFLNRFIFLGANELQIVELK